MKKHETLGRETFTKYEKARIIGSRALQLSLGAPILVPMDAKKLKEVEYNPIRIALLEYEKGVIPITIRRPLPKKKKTS
ncbi:DNA-directed RNA polymerase subunit K [Candidatus Woesearchaeota archaeon]|nr:MAG: DNA-directed RNA polymerase subunit K [Candidatus Woesearchaeota archaeon]